MELEPVSEGPGHRFAGVGNVLVCVYWASPPTDALLERLPWVERTVAEAGSVGLLVVVHEEAAGQLPGPAFRKESRRQAERFQDQIVLSATAILGDDVSHSLIRTFLRGLAVVAARKIDVRFFDDTTDAARWTAEGMAAHGGPSVSELLQAVEALRER